MNKRLRDKHELPQTVIEALWRHLDAAVPADLVSRIMARVDARAALPEAPLDVVEQIMARVDARAELAELELCEEEPDAAVAEPPPRASWCSARARGRPGASQLPRASIRAFQRRVSG
jgi:hypothetical protein